MDLPPPVSVFSFTRIRDESVRKSGATAGIKRGSTKKLTRQNTMVVHPAFVVALLQYIPTQNKAAKVIGTIQVNWSCLNMSSMVTEMTTAPKTTIPPVKRPSETHSLSVAFGLMKGT